MGPSDPALGSNQGPSVEATRQRIIAVALELIAQQGFAATSTREITERLGLTKAALYYHFRTKDDLLRALLKPSIDQFAELIEAGERDTSDERRTRVLAQYVNLVAENEDLIRVLSQDPAARRLPASSGAAPLYERITRILAGRDDPDSAERAEVRAVLAGIHAVFIYASPEDDRNVLHSTALATASRSMGFAMPTSPTSSGTSVDPAP